VGTKVSNRVVGCMLGDQIEISFFWMNVVIAYCTSILNATVPVGCMECQNSI
jgi:hypothetical protein